MKKISKLFTLLFLALGTVTLGASLAGAQAYSTNASGDVIMDISVNLSQGTRGEFVKILQAFLAAEADVYAEGTVDGSFGPRTRQAVVNFQSKNGLKADGKVGPLTRAKIKEQIKDRPLARVKDASGNVSLCAFVPPGHMIAPGYLRKIGSRPIMEMCQNLPPGIAKKLDNFPPSGGDTTAPIISGVSITGVTSAGATISWTTDEAATGQVSYGTTASYGSETSLSSGLVNAHQAVLVGLAANTTYHYQLKSRDAGGNLGVSVDYIFTTGNSTAVDITAPLISGAAVSDIFSTSAKVSWTTNENADARVDYGTTTAYGSVAADASFTGSHSLTLSGLSANTTYHYKVTSKDSAGNTVVSADATFSTSASTDVTAPVISAISVSATGTTVATVSWATNENSTGKVYYSTSASFDNSTASVQSSAALSLSHSFALTGLTAGTTYYFKVESIDGNNNTATSSLQSFTTLTL